MIKNVKKTSKLMSAVSAVIAVVMLGTTVFASGVLSDIATDGYTVEISNNGEIIELANKPFIENGEVYLPLRETVEKVGIMDNEYSYINWDNGVIGICLSERAEGYVTHQSPAERSEQEVLYMLYNYTIEIGKAELTENAAPTLTGQDVSRKRDMDNSPVLKGSTAYVPYSYLHYMFSLGNYRDWDIDYTVYDKNGNLLDKSYEEIEIKWTPEPEIFADPYSDFLIYNLNKAMEENALSSTYNYEYARHRYKDANNKVDFYYQIKPFGEDEIKFLKMSFEKRGDEWTMYDTGVADEINDD